MATGRSTSARSHADESTASEGFEVRPTADSHFAWLRTRLAMERTLMSTGTLALVVAASQYRRLLRHMWQPGFRVLAGVDEGRPWYHPILFVTALLIVIGVFAAVVVGLRIP
jgi:putative membrane protein